VAKACYRIEVELRSQETLATAPAQTEVNRGDLDAGRDFAVALDAQP